MPSWPHRRWTLGTAPLDDWINPLQIPAQVRSLACVAPFYGRKPRYCGSCVVPRPGICCLSVIVESLSDRTDRTY